MRIINRTQFLALQGEVLFSEYCPTYFSELQIKLCNAGTNDYCVQQVLDPIKSRSSSEFTELLLDAEENGTPLELDFDCGGRDGAFRNEQLYAVWERRDVEALIARLQQTLGEMQ